MLINPFRTFGKNVANWTKMENIVEANATDHNSSLQITTSQKGIVWLDQVSAMPLDTYKVIPTLSYPLFFLIKQYKLL